MTGIFKKNNPSGRPLLFVYAILVKFPLLFKTGQIQKLPTDGVLFKFIGNIINTIGSSFPPVYNIVTFVILFFQAIIINKIASEQKLHKQTNYLTGMSYLLITSLFPEWFYLSAALLVNTLLLLAFSKICTLYYNANPKTNLFNIGLIVGIVAFISFPSILFLVLAITGIIIARPLAIKEFIIVFIGITVPIYVFTAYLFLTDKLYTYKLPVFTFSKVNFEHGKAFYYAEFILVIGLVIGAYFVNQNFNRQVVQTRKSWQLLFFYFIIAALIPFTNANSDFTYWVLIAVPAAPIVAAAFFYPTKKWVAITLHALMFIVIIYSTFWHK